VQDRILGKEEDITHDKAVKTEDGKWVGGVQFERSDMAKSLKNGPRCYPVASTLQIQKMLSAPGKGMKVLSLCPSEDAQLRKDILEVSFDPPSFFFLF